MHKLRQHVCALGQAPMRDRLSSWADGVCSLRAAGVGTWQRERMMIQACCVPERHETEEVEDGDGTRDVFSGGRSAKLNSSRSRRISGAGGSWDVESNCDTTPTPTRPALSLKGSRKDPHTRLLTQRIYSAMAAHRLGELPYSQNGCTLSPAIHHCNHERIYSFS